MKERKKEPITGSYDVYSTDNVCEQSNNLLNTKSLASSFELAIIYVDLIDLSNDR
jgi:hypothetical protein